MKGGSKMKRFLCALVVAVALLVVLSLPAWAAYEFYGTKGLEHMCSNPQIVQSGVLDKIKPLALSFGNQLGALLLGNNRSWSWGESVGGAMNKGAELFNTKTYDMFLGKSPDICCNEFLHSWNYGGLQLSENTKSQINTLTRNTFQQIGQILSNLQRSTGFLKIEQQTGKIFPKVESGEYKEGLR
jgi:hypothetical protein